MPRPLSHSSIHARPSSPLQRVISMPNFRLHWTSPAPTRPAKTMAASASRPFLSSRPTTIAAHLSSLFTPSPFPRRCFPYSSPFSTTSRTPGLRPPSPPPPDVSDDPDAAPAPKSRNELKREARRAVKWGMELAEFTVPQIKRIVEAASLEREVFDAIILAKRMGPDVREGKRRQFNYIGRLLRTAEPELLNALIQASKDGDNDKVLALSSQKTLSSEDDDEEQETDNDEACKNYLETAARWSDGLIYKDQSIINEVYSIHNVEFDRQELRKLVRRVQSIQEGPLVEESGESNNATLARAKKPLIRFLSCLAKQSLAN